MYGSSRLELLGDLMTEDEAEEDWTSYSSAQYGTGESIFEEDNLNEIESKDEEFDYYEDNYEITPAPSISGQTHLVRIGCCDFCLGRVGGVSLIKKTLKDAGLEVRNEVLKLNPGLEIDETVCPLCENLFSEIDIITSRLISELNDFEFSRLQLGFQLPNDLLESEEYLRTTFGAKRSSNLKQALSSEISTKIRTLLENDFEIVNEFPEILALIDCLTLSVKLECRSLYLYTRYCKFERGLPQTKWNCRTCKGRGCEKCDNTGLQYLESVQSLIADPLLDVFLADSHSTHSMGREDIDVRCLGNGRPTVIELKNPKKRFADLNKLTELVNKAASGRVEIKELRISNKSEVVRVKDAAADKSYHICFRLSNIDDEGNEFEIQLTDEEIISKISELNGAELNQRTPKRVSHRRADKIRKRKIIDLYEINVDDKIVEFKLRAQSGTYIKEMVTSDHGRTDPSVAKLLDLKCEVEWLDVLDIHSD